MIKIEQMHLDVIEDKIYYDERKYEVNGKSSAAFKSAEITEQIAIEFTKFCLNKAKDLDIQYVYHNIDNEFQKFLKTKQ